MTVDECAKKVIDTCLGPLTASGDPQDAEKAAANVLAALQALIWTESKRCAWIFNRYVQARDDAWGPGASNQPKASDYLNEILRASPGNLDKAGKAER